VAALAGGAEPAACAIETEETDRPAPPPEQALAHPAKGSTTHRPRIIVLRRYPHAGRLEFGPGDLHHLPRGEARGHRMPDRCYALEYARGIIPTMLPFGLADSFTSTVDPMPVMDTLRIYTRAVVGELLKGKI
jgi:hypothetical protein